MAININQYADVRAVLDQVINQDRDEAVYTLPTVGEAIRWRQRANRLRVAIRKADAIRREVSEPEGTSPYDHLIFRLRPNETVITINSQKKLGGELTFADGPTPEQVTENIDELEGFLSDYKPADKSGGGEED